MPPWLETKYTNDLRERLPVRFDAAVLLGNVCDMYPKLYVPEAHHMVVRLVPRICEMALDKDVNAKLKALFAAADPEASREQEVKPLLKGKSALGARLDAIERRHKMFVDEFTRRGVAPDEAARMANDMVKGM